ncbi:MAG: S8 family serine peptidase [Clostridia bacterium]
MMIHKISPSLYYAVKCLSVEKLNVIVYVKNSWCFKQIARFKVVREYPFINAVGISCFPYELEHLSRLPYVEYIQSNAQVFALDEEMSNEKPVENFKIQTNLTGKGVTLCVLDTGIQPHLDICAPFNRLKDFYDVDNPNERLPYDDNGHGTFVTGVAAGNGFASGSTLSGVATKANIVGVKVIKANGESGAFSVLDGMQWVLDNRRKLNIRVACMSFGSNPFEQNDPLKRGAETLVRSGITVVCASGNSGENAVKSPATSMEVISVGAVNEKNEIADFTSRGYVNGRQKPEIYASGVDVIGLEAFGTYGKMSGTSVSTPYVAGAACLLVERFPSITPHRIKEILLKTAENIDGHFVLKL